MTEPRLDFVVCPDGQEGHRMAYWHWGDPAAGQVIVCMHGLTRQGRDFDALARALLAQARTPLRVVCPDVVGRGRSDWLRDPQGYQVPQYAGDMLAMLAALHAVAPVEALDCVGTSMGGLIGMVLAGAKDVPLPAPVRRLVLNDVGPAVEPAAIARIASYVGRGGPYPDLQAAADALWSISTGFGPHTPEQWLALTRPMVVPAAERSTDGRSKTEAGPAAGGAGLVLHYDPAIAEPIRALTPGIAAQAQAAAWAIYDAIRAPTLLLRGAQSDLLSPATAQAMTQRGPRARLVEFGGVGHAPTLIAPAQIEAVASFLLDR
ncbi:MAG: alpha/beta hydrolase [Xenophilus sp.]